MAYFSDKKYYIYKYLYPLLLLDAQGSFWLIKDFFCELTEITLTDVTSKSLLQYSSCGLKKKKSVY